MIAILSAQPPPRGHAVLESTKPSADPLLFVGVLIALFVILTFTRHTRSVEESGQLELVRAGRVGRAAPFVAAALYTAGAITAISLGQMAVLSFIDSNALDVAGSATFAASVASIGALFLGITTVSNQFFVSARTSAGAVGTLLAAAVLVRGFGDVQDSALSLASPFGWAQRTYPWFTNDWKFAFIGVAVGTALTFLAVISESTRDYGSALIGHSRGRARARRFLIEPPGLATRLSRSTIVTWTIAMAVFGTVYGPVLTDAQEFVDQMPILADVLGTGADTGGVRVFAAIVVALAALLCAVPGLQVMSRLIADERAGRTMLLLSTFNRNAWFLSTIALAITASAIPLGAFGVSFGLSGSLSRGEGQLAGDIALAALSYLPAIAVTIAVAALMIGWLPAASWLGWVYLGYASTIFFFADLLDWPSWASYPAAFDHIVARPALETSSNAPIILTAIAIVALILAAVGYRTREIR